MRAVLLVAIATVLSLAPPVALFAAEGDQLDADERMFTVMAALNAAGYERGVGTAGDSLVRQVVRQRLAGFDGESLPLLRTAIEQWEADTEDDFLTQFVSYALVCEPAPTFELTADLPTDLPPEVRRMRGFGPLLAQFYREAGIGDLWLEYQPAFAQEMDRYQAVLAPLLFRTAGYLRLTMGGREASTFKVWIDLLGPPGSVSTRLWGGIVQVVAHPADKVPVDEIRHAFLIHMLDRIAVRYRDLIAEKEVLSRFALFAPALDQAYKEDFELLITKSLVYAAEARLDRGSDQEKRARLDQRLREGFILAPYFYDALAAFEDDGRDINKYYPEMIQAIDLKKEAARLQNTTFVEAPERKERAPVRVELSALDKALQRGEFLLNEEMFDEAREAFEQADDLAEGGNGQALYGMARVAVMEADPELARELFTDAAAVSDDPHIRAMSYLYLGRIADIVGERDLAVEHYQRALEQGDPSEQTRKLAEQGLGAAFQSPRQKAAEQERLREEQQDAQP